MYTGFRIGNPGDEQADDLQTIYGGSAGRSGVATETSSLLDSQSDYQEYVKCILQCKQLFGEGVSTPHDASSLWGCEDVVYELPHVSRFSWSFCRFGWPEPGPDVA